MIDLAARAHLRQPKSLAKALPGLVLAGLIGGLGFALHGLPQLSAFSPAILATVIGMVLAHTIRIPESAEAGIALASKTLLRLAVALLGLQVSFGQIVSVGLQGFLVVAAGLFVSFAVIRFVGARLGVAPKLATLIAAGTSICGASAVAGVNTVTEAPDEDVAYAIALVTLFGTAAMLVLPLVDQFLFLDPRHYGLWAGASIHEVAQVVGATTQVGEDATRTGAIAKLTRIMLLAPLVMVLRFRVPASERKRAVAVPLFVIGFVVLMVLNSLITLPHEVIQASGQVSGFLLAMALGAMGLKTHVGALKAKGWSPLALGAFGALFISLFTLGLIGAFA